MISFIEEIEIQILSDFSKAACLLHRFEFLVPLTQEKKKSHSSTPLTSNMATTCEGKEMKGAEDWHLSSTWSASATLHMSSDFQDSRINK